ncbi:diguanylate cyclase [Pseudomonas sp. FSL R10-0056]|uniref:diguanylate cyclase n=1 Tax=unclassified Pseudomonas TaxID=196821 RepID=UPI0012956073|nr:MULTISPECIES: diguanylate cyclase [unclassified Pseudomonas]MDN5406960.1 diguanylate cyclase [Pseudomonas sp.]MDN5448698.1 diguanylate cyclase [Pseudomonas sp.]MDN5455120.1 diguanylate cyclase [Pseudomonas sp.]MDN5456323.1 diguanylate cyclase [Pseudomonas sp.]MDN5497275.1 diguanylate cyclase [Pseudomonas sp.]
MRDEAARWKEKYLKSVELQDKLERRWNARLDLLRRGLVRSTLAAEGTDRTVDQCMKEMREAVRTNEMDAALAALLPRLEKAVLDSEQRRETRVEQVSAALNTLVTQLQALPLPREVSKPLKAYAKQLENRVTHAREIPLLLGELSHLQGQALAPQLNDAQPPKPGLLQRLFGAQDAEKALGEATVVPIPVETQAPRPAAPNSVVPAHVAEPPAVPTPQPEPVIVEAQPSPPVATADDDAQALAEPSPSVPQEAQEHASSGALESVVAMVEAENDQARDFVEQSPLDEQTELAEVDAVYALPDAPEPTYSSVAEHIESTLLGLLSGLSLPEHHRPQAEAMCRRLEKGLNWYELLPILDDLAVLMLAITDSGQHEFEAYLKQLNERLESFQNNLQAASEGHAEGRSAADDLHSQLREHVDGLQNSVQDAVDLNSLKHLLENRLEGLLGTMDQHQQQRIAREQEVSAHLQGLAERIASMEQQAQGYREHLEEQRQKALIDPLTDLPNRAAWGERLQYEVDQWQKNGNPLLIAMLDLDHFKRINDGYGHLAGDKVLKIIATQLRKHLRPTDFIARFGGEEFVLLMPDTPLSAGLHLIEKLRAAIQACPFHFKGEPVTITTSIGVSAFRPGDRSDHVLKRADEALYRAKRRGRNCVEPQAATIET